MTFRTNALKVQAFAGALYGVQVGTATMAQVNADIASNGGLANTLNGYYSSAFGSVANATVAASVAANLGLTGDALASGTAYITAQLNATAAGARGALISTILDQFAGLASDATFGAAATAYNAKVEVANAYTGAANVTMGSTVSQGTAFTLTVGADVHTGTAGNDTFNALTVNAAGAAADTVTAFDALNGGAGNDTLNIYTSATENDTFPATASVTGIETVNIYNIDAAHPAALADASKFAGVTALWQHAAAVDVTKLAATTTAGFSKLDATAAADLDVTAADAATTVAIALDAVKGQAADNVADIDLAGKALTSVTVSGTLANKSTDAKEVFTATFGVADIGDHVHFDGTFYAAAANGTAIEAATAFVTWYNAQPTVNWVAVDNGDATATFTAKLAGDVADVTDFGTHGDMVITVAAPTVQGGAKVADAVLALNITVAKDATAGTVNTAVATTLTIDNDGASTKNLLSLDASASAGAIKYSSADDKVASIKTGAGKDTVSLNTATLKDDVATTTVVETISGVLESGAGDDTLTVAVTGTGTTAVDAGDGNDKVTLKTSAGEKVTINAGAGNDTVTIQDAAAAARKLGSADVVNGGDGTDTLVMGGTTFTAGDYVILAANASGFETLQFSQAATADASKLSAYGTLKTSVDGVTLTKVADAQTLSTAKDVTATSAGYIAKDTGATPAVAATTYAGTLKVDASTAGVALTANTSAVNLTVSATAGTATAASAAADVTLTGDAQTATVTLNSVASKTAGQTAASTADSAATFSLTTTTGTSAGGASTNMGGLTSLTLTGSGSATIVNGAKLATVDASGLTGKAVFDGVTLTNGLTFTGSDALAETVTLSGGKDAVTTAATYAKTDTITGLNLVATAAVTPTLDAAKSDDLTITGFNTATEKAFVKSTTITGSTLDLALVNAAASASNQLVFQYGGDTYAYVDLGTTGALDNADVLVKLTGTINLDLLAQALNA